MPRAARAAGTFTTHDRQQDRPLILRARVPIVGGRTGGLKPGDDVRIAGVKVGKVTSVDLEDGHAVVGITP